MDIKEILYRLRVNRGLSQQNVADELGVDISTYSRYEKGKAELKISHAKKLADLYSLTLDQFYNYGERPTKEAPLDTARIEEGIDILLKKKRQKSVSLTIELDGSNETVNHYLKLISELNKVVAASL